MSDESKKAARENRPGVENGEADRPSKRSDGRFVKGGKPGPGRPKTIHAAPLVEGDTEAMALLGISAKALEPMSPADGPPLVDESLSDELAAVPPHLAPFLKRDGLTAVYQSLVAQAAKGKDSAEKVLFKFVDHYEKEPSETASIDVASAYSGLRESPAQMRRELDIGLSRILHRWRIGFCLDPIEQRIADMANAVLLRGPESRQISRWAGVKIPEITALNQKNGVEDEAQVETDQRGTTARKRAGKSAGRCREQQRNKRRE